MEQKPGLTNSRIDSYLIVTPYWRTIAKLPALTWVEDCKDNHNSYDLFKLRIAIESVIYNTIRGNSKPSFQFESIQLEGKMVRTIVFYRNMDTVMRTSVALGKLVEETITSVHNDNYVILFDSNIDNEIMPAWKMRSIISKIKVSGYTTKIVQGKLMIDLSDYQVTYMDVYSALLVELTKVLNRGKSKIFTLDGDVDVVERVSRVGNSFKINMYLDLVDIHLAMSNLIGYPVIAKDGYIYITDTRLDDNTIRSVVSIVESSINSDESLTVSYEPVMSLKLIESKKSGSSGETPIILNENTIVYSTGSYYVPHMKSVLIHKDQMSTQTIYQ